MKRGILGKRILIAFAWGWTSAFVSLLVMADPGTITMAMLPVDVLFAMLGVFLGPLFFFAGLLGRGHCVSPGIHLMLALLAYCLYIALLWAAIISRKASVRYVALSIITVASFIAWQGLRNSI